jgi:hypothetical protein
MPETGVGVLAAASPAAVFVAVGEVGVGVCDFLAGCVPVGTGVLVSACVGVDVAVKTAVLVAVSVGLDVTEPVGVAEGVLVSGVPVAVAVAVASALHVLIATSFDGSESFMWRLAPGQDAAPLSAPTPGSSGEARRPPHSTYASPAAFVIVTMDSRSPALQLP